MNDDFLLLGQIFATHRGMTRSTVSTYMTGSGATFRRLEEGRSITLRRANRILQNFSDHWPAELAWPEGIERPAPSPDSPAAQSVLGGPEYRNDTSVAKLLAYREQLLAQDDYVRAAHVQEAAIAAASVLDARGRIVRPNDLCAALEVPRYVYDQVIRHYADGKPRQDRFPRRARFGQSPSEQMLRTLTASGDVRFAKRRERGRATLARVEAVS